MNRLWLIAFSIYIVHVLPLSFWYLALKTRLVVSSITTIKVYFICVLFRWASGVSTGRKRYCCGQSSEILVTKIRFEIRKENSNQDLEYWKESSNCKNLRFGSSPTEIFNFQAAQQFCCSVRICKSPLVNNVFLACIVVFFIPFVLFALGICLNMFCCWCMANAI